MAVIREVFSRNGELVRDDAIREVARTLGYRRTGSHIQEIIGRTLMAASRRGVICRDRELYQLDCRTIDEYKRDDLVKYLAAAVGRIWHTRDEAIKAAARYLGFRRTGRNKNTEAKTRVYLERPRGHSKTADIAVMVVWALAFAPRMIKGYGIAKDKEQSKLLRDSIQKLLR